MDSDTDSPLHSPYLNNERSVTNSQANPVGGKACSPSVVYCAIYSTQAPGCFAQKPVPPGTVRAKNIFRTGRFLPGRFAHFSKNDFKVLVIKINQVNAMCMLN